MKRALLLSALLPFAALAQDRAAGVIYSSGVVTNKAWSRAVVMRHEPTGEIFNDNGTVGRAADVAAANQTADEAGSPAGAPAASQCIVTVAAS